MSPKRPRNPYGGWDTFDAVVEALILLAVGLMAAAASFTHVHDATLKHSPAGTPSWFGWSNSFISELVPLAVLFWARRRRRRGLKVGLYPFFMILGAVALSMWGQITVAVPTITGWIVSCVPALAFLAITKLVMTKPKRAKDAELDPSAPAQQPAPAQVPQAVFLPPQPVPAQQPAPVAVPAQPMAAVPAKSTARQQRVTARVTRQGRPPYPGPKVAKSGLTGKPLEALNSRTGAPRND